MIFITRSIESQPNYQSLGCLKYLTMKNAKPLLSVYIDWEKKLMNFANKVKHVRTKFLKADYPLRFVNSVITNYHCNGC